MNNKGYRERETIGLYPFIFIAGSGNVFYLIPGGINIILLNINGQYLNSFELDQFTSKT